MNEIRDILQTALPDTPPPSSITSQTAIDAGLRLRRRRRAAVASVASGLAVLVVIGGVAWVRGATVPVGVGFGAPMSATSTGAAPPTGPTASTSTEPSPSESGQPSPSGSDGPAALIGIAPTVTAALIAATNQEAPGVRIEGVRGAFALMDLGPYETVKSQGGIKAWALLVDSKGPGTLFINLNGGGDPSRAATCPEEPGVTCTTRVGPAGEPIVITEGNQNATVKYLQVSIVKADGTDVIGILKNYSQNDQPIAKGTQPHGQRTTQVLTQDQLVAILLAAGVVIPPGLDLQP